MIYRTLEDGMKDIATIDGVTITRTQVEQALKEMNKPEPTYKDFKPGSLVSTRWGQAIVVNDQLRRILQVEFKYLSNDSEVWSISLARGEALVTPVYETAKVL